ncbi:MAG: MAE_28990/MAE_18760 family HEPN-like nuclease [Myxococcota bacterium]
MDPQEFKTQLANLADGRLRNLKYVERVSSEFSEGHILRPMANAMAIAMAYAQFEGYVKDALQQYLEFVERQNVPRMDVNPCLLAYSWGPAFRALRTNSSLNARIKFARARADEAEHPLRFSKGEREIDTRSNLLFEVLDELATTLGLDRASLTPYKQKLNALVRKRNSIAHGNRAETVTVVEVEESLHCVRALFAVIESCLHAAVDDRAYLREGSRASA